LVVTFYDLSVVVPKHLLDSSPRLDVNPCFVKSSTGVVP
jgi:hypothetical protein